MASVSPTVSVNAKLPQPANPKIDSTGSLQGKKVEKLSSCSCSCLKPFAVVLVIISIAAILSAAVVGASLLLAGTVPLLSTYIVTPLVAVLGTTKWVAIAAGITAVLGSIQLTAGILILNRKPSEAGLVDAATLKKQSTKNSSASTVAPPILLSQFGNESSELELGNKGLYEFPGILCNFTDVANIKLNDNKLKELPAEFKNFVNLRVLDISENRFEKMPEVIGSLPNLFALIAKGTGKYKLKSLPETLANPKLLHLEISGNALTDLPGSMGQMSKLQDLDAARNKIHRLPDSFKNLKSIKAIDLSFNELKEFPKVLCEMTSLEKIILQGNDFDEIPESISKLTNLKVLDIRQTKVKKLPETIKSLKNLKVEGFIQDSVE